MGKGMGNDGLMDEYNAAPKASIGSYAPGKFEMDDSMYDEFGNYIGPELEDDDRESDDELENAWAGDDGADMQMRDQGIRRSYSYSCASLLCCCVVSRKRLSELSPLAMRGKMHPLRADDEDEEAYQVVLHEDKKYYPTADEVYGDAEVIVQEEDTQPLETPIIAPVKNKNFDLVETTPPVTTYSTEFVCSLMNYPELLRNIAVVGHLHHGKTAFMDMLVTHTHPDKWHAAKEIRYTDTRVDEQKRGLSQKAVPMSLVLESSANKSHLFNIMDTPGHVNFSDEGTAAMRLADGVVLVVDAIEGVMSNTERLIKCVAPLAACCKPCQFMAVFYVVPMV